MVAGKIEFDLARGKLGLLQAENIGVDRIEKVHKAFADARAQAVHVPGNKFHGVLRNELSQSACPALQNSRCFYHNSFLSFCISLFFRRTVS